MDFSRSINNKNVFIISAYYFDEEKNLIRRIVFRVTE